MRNTLVVLLTVISLCACDVNRITGTYMANARPQQLIYLALTQTQETIDGAMTVVTPNGKGGVASQTIPIRGTADGSAISLMAERFLNNLAITGQKRGSSITLTFPSVSGGLATLSFEPASENDFNGAVTKWRQVLSMNYTEQVRLKAQQAAEHQKLEKLAGALNYNVEAIKATGIGDDLSQAKSELKDERSALKELEGDFAELKHKASLRPMTCYRAYQSVAYDLQQVMGYAYKQNLGYANSRFRLATRNLDKRFSVAASLIHQTKKNSIELRDAIQLSTFPLPKLVISPGDERGQVEQYEMLVRSSKDEIPALKAQNDGILAKAKLLIQEGKGVMEAAQSLVRCR